MVYHHQFSIQIAILGYTLIRSEYTMLGETPIVIVACIFYEYPLSHPHLMVCPTLVASANYVDSRIKIQ